MTISTSWSMTPGAGEPHIIRSIRQAIERTDDALARNFGADIRASLVEMLDWIHKFSPHKGTTPNWEASLPRDLHETLEALRCARNASHHARPAMIRGTSGDSAVLWTWDSLEGADRFDNGKPRRGLAEYETRLMGRSIESTLREIEAILRVATANA